MYLCGFCGNEIDLHHRDQLCSCGVPFRQGIIYKHVINYNNLSIYNTSSTDIIHQKFKDLQQYTCSEYYDDATDHEVMHQDLCNLTFENESFDMVITQDIIEHVIDPFKALNEINRVLRPNGFHLWTIPIDEDIETASCTYELYHGDPLRECGIKVYTLFGFDIIDMIPNTSIIEKYIIFEKVENLNYNLYILKTIKTPCE